MADCSKLLVRWLHELWNQGNVGIIEELLTEKSIIHDGANTTVGPQAFREFYSRMGASFDDIQMTTHEEIASGDLACVRWTSTFRHTGDGLGIPATGRTVTTTGICMARFDANGRVAEGWQNWDMLGVMQQLQQPAPSHKMYISA